MGFYLAAHPPTPLCLSLTTHTLPLPCLSLTTHTLPLPSASPSPTTPSHSPLPLPHHPHPPTPLCLSLTTHTLPLPSASPSPLSDKLSDGSFLDRLTSTTDESLAEFVQSTGVLLSSPNRAIITATMDIFEFLIWSYPKKLHLALVNANLIPLIIDSLNVLSLSLTEEVDIHTSVMSVITCSFLLTTHVYVEDLETEDADEQQSVHETVLKKVLISSYYQPTMDFIHQMPVGLTIPSYLTFFEDDESICNTLFSMNKFMQEWNETKGKSRQMWKTVDRVLRMEGIEDVIEGKLQNDQNEYFGGRIIVRSIDLSGQQGINAPKLE
ncbi:hypothetical protein BLNAU_18587 [Blattamonas nauphoetae]|uniref:Uncharacterized protein n=1 Tax=Blattamonas nauphoetae TaxID=2049346 RepID=A0ABQ9X6E8_9EUKA|nr:hypothetical protein BLNAU_18587 [Blattamonas nauphoetae]